MEGMKAFPDKYFDLAIVDPPYGIKPVSNFGVKEAIKFSKEDVLWDIKPDKQYFDELFKISQNQIIWGGNYFKLKGTRCFLIWDKLNGDNPFADCEYAWTSFNNSARMFKYFWLGAHIHRIEDVIHPTQKPVQLYKWILHNYAKPDFKIIDTHAGGCSSVIAFLDFGCDWIAFEIDKDYYEAANTRIEKHKKRPKPFFTDGELANKKINKPKEFFDK